MLKTHPLIENLNKIELPQLTYTSQYCEENIYKLVEFLHTNKSYSHYFQTDDIKLYTVFISNENKLIPIWCQTLSSEPQFPVVWDYHVILLIRINEESWIYDFDTRLNKLTPAPYYFLYSFRQPDIYLDEPKYWRRYRLVEDKQYLKWFSCDRSHMLDANGNYIKPPPSYDCIVGDDKMDTNNLKDYLNMSELNVEHDKFGQCLDEDSFEKNFVLRFTENQIEFIKSNNLLV